MFNNASDKDFKDSDVLRLLITTKGKLILTFAIDYSKQVVTGYDKMINEAEIIQKKIDEEYK